MASRLALTLEDAGALDALIEVLEALGGSSFDLGAEGTFLALLPGSAEELRPRLVSAFERAGLGGAIAGFELAPARTTDDGATLLEALRPLALGPLWILPPGAAVPGDRTVQAVLRIDPSQAFGSGLHPSTALCLEALLAARPLEGKRVLDVGTGSGILALAALALGAPTAVGVDPDPAAREAAKKNAEENRLAERFQLEASIPRDLRAELVLANILGAVLLELAPRLVESLAAGGRLVLSGIRESEREEITLAYLRFGLRALGADARGGWWCLVFGAAW